MSVLWQPWETSQSDALNMSSDHVIFLEKPSSGIILHSSDISTLCWGPPGPIKPNLSFPLSSARSLPSLPSPQPHLHSFCSPNPPSPFLPQNLQTKRSLHMGHIFPRSSQGGLGKHQTPMPLPVFSVTLPWSSSLQCLHLFA